MEATNNRAAGFFECFFFIAMHSQMKLNEDSNAMNTYIAKWNKLHIICHRDNILIFFRSFYDDYSFIENNWAKKGRNEAPNDKSK